MSIRHAIRSAAAAVAVLAAAGSLAAPAEAAVPRHARLNIVAAGYGYYNVYVFGQAGAANASFGVRLYGDDEWFDDYLTNQVGYLRTGYDGYFSTVLTVPGSTLNEDWGQDEVYAVVDVSGAGSLRSNTVKGRF